MSHRGAHLVNRRVEREVEHIRADGYRTARLETTASHWVARVTVHDAHGRAFRVRITAEVGRYPFVAPSVTVNGRSYLPLLASTLFSVPGGHCVCCDSLLCTTKRDWTPMVKLLDLVREVHRHLLGRTDRRGTACSHSVARQRLTPDVGHTVAAFFLGAPARP